MRGWCWRAGESSNSGPMPNSPRKMDSIRRSRGFRDSPREGLDERERIDKLLVSFMKNPNPSDAIEEALREAPQVDLSWIVPPPTADGWTLAPDALRFV